MNVIKRQSYHLEPEKGLLNDPNGLAYYKGKYHVFFQWNRFEKNHSYKEWGHFTSSNLIVWKFEGTALMPDQAYDKDGVYSGSSYVKKNKLYLFYTGNQKEDGIRKSSQCLAVTEDGKRFIKKGIILSTPEAYTEHFRDPKVWGTESEYYMVVGAQRESGKGAIALCKSVDGEHWNFEKTLAVSETCEMIECPDLFRIEQTNILTYCPQQRNNEKDISISSYAAYKLVDFDKKCGMLVEPDLDKNQKLLDYGFDFYAPQTFNAPDGRRILFAWMSRMQEEEEKAFGENEKSIHCMTLPRELSIMGNELCQNPIKELEQCLVEHQEIKQMHHVRFLSFLNRSYCLKLLEMENEDSFIIEFLKQDAVIKYNRIDRKFHFFRTNWVSNKREEKFCEVEKIESIEIWSDNSSIELFINRGKKVISSRIYPHHKEGDICIKGISDKATIKMYYIDIEKKGDYHE